MSDEPESAAMDLLDRIAITDLAVAYCWAIDGGDWGRLDEVFAADATANFATAVEHAGREAIVERIRAALSPLDASQHMVSNHEVRIAGDRATHRCQMRAQHVRAAAEGGPNYIIAGRYEDQVVRTEAGWRIAHRDLLITWTDGNPLVVRP